MHSHGLTLLTHGVIVVTMAFVAYYTVIRSSKRWITDTVTRTVLQRLAGTCFLLVPMFLFYNEAPLHIEYHEIPKTIALTFLFSMLALLTSARRKRGEKDRLMYPAMRETQWTILVTLLNALSWMVYLFPYEFIMRGILLGQAMETFNVGIAVVISGVGYAVAHAPQGWRETLFSFPFGILLCGLTLITGNFWCAYVIHVALALSNDYFAARKNSAFQFTTPSSNFVWHSIKKTLL